MTGPSRSASRMGKEQEVDSLTDLLVQGMSGVGSDVEQEDIYGVCVKCAEKVSRESLIWYIIIISIRKIGNINLIIPELQISVSIQISSPVLISLT